MLCKLAISLKEFLRFKKNFQNFSAIWTAIESGGGGAADYS